MNTKSRLLRAVADLLEADAAGDAENFKEFWEDCESPEEIRAANKMLFELARELRERSAEARETHVEGT
jgi:hypothetical protein